MKKVLLIGYGGTIFMKINGNVVCEVTSSAP